jgi:hypothetical protein
VAGLTLRPVICVAALAAACCMQALSEDGPAEASSVEISPGDEAAIRSVFDHLAAAMEASDASAIGALLSDSLSLAERGRIISWARGEFEKIYYPDYSFDISGPLGAESLGPSELRVVVPARYEYESRVEGGGMADHGENAYEFRLVRSGADWKIAGSDLFQQFTAVHLEKVFGWVFLGGFLLTLVVFFWGWMVMDVWMRTKRLRYGLLLILLTPVGAALYFFAFYLRKRFVPREDE